MERGSPPCSPQIPTLSRGEASRPSRVASSTNRPTPSLSRTWKGSSEKIPASMYRGRKVAASSREIPYVVCVRSFVPKEKNSASSAIDPAVSAARGNSIIVPTR